MGQGSPSKDIGEQVPQKPPGPPPFPSFETSDAGIGFQRFITNRWPRSLILPQFPDESDGDFHTRDRIANDLYLGWIKDSYNIFILNPGRFVLPYNSRSVSNPIRNFYNFPPLEARLKYPPHVGDHYDSTQFMKLFTILESGTTYEDDWVVTWNRVNTLYPVELWSIRNRDNFLLEPTLDQPENEDVEAFKQKWRSWFTSTWPMCSDFIGYLNQSPFQIQQCQQEAQDQYEEWVELNFQKLITRIPNVSEYWNWPMPYDRNPKNGTMINVPSRTCQLKSGERRTDVIIGRELIPGRDIIGEAVYKERWVLMYYQRRLNYLEEFAGVSFDISRRIGDELHMNIDGPSYWDGIGNYFWGYGGKMGRFYPIDFPPPYDKDLEQGIYNYGLARDWPCPYDVVSNFILKESTSIPFPPIEILLYWDDLVKAYESQNPRLYIPNYQQLAPIKAKKNFDTNRPGFKMFPEGHPYLSHLTFQMAEVDTKYKSDLHAFETWLFSFCERDLVLVGVFKEDVYSNPTIEYKVWRQAVIQAIHLRYAERHAFYPWERFLNVDTIRNPIFPEPDEFWRLVASQEVKLEWGKWVWADNFKTDAQKKSIQMKMSPYDYLPFTSDILPWNTLIYLLKAVDYRRKQKQDAIMDINRLNSTAIDDFGLFIAHTRRYRVIPDSQIPDVNEAFCDFLRGYCGLSRFASRQTWEKGLGFLLEVMFDQIIEAQPQVKLIKEGECIIDPARKLDDECVIFREPSPNPDPYAHEVKNGFTLCLRFWETQWRNTEGLLGWPKYRIIDGELSPIEGTGEPIPDFWKKLWNTFFNFQPGLGVQIPPGGGTVDIIEGFILPKATGKGYSEEILDTYAFMRLYGIPILRTKPAFMTINEWEDMKREQWASYIEWVRINVRAMNELPESKYISPGEYMKDLEGNKLINPHDSNRYLINAYPSFGVFGGSSQGNLQWLLSPGEWIEKLFGKDTWQMLRYLANQTINLVLDTFKHLIDAFGGLETLWKIMIVGGIVIVGFLGVNTIVQRTLDRPLSQEEAANLGRKRLRQ
jgi:hypothetical protein